MATPHVTGAAALYASMYADSNAVEIKQAILASTTPTASLAGKAATGGRLNIAGWFGSVGGPAPDAPTSLSVLSVSGADVRLDLSAAQDADDSTTYNVLRKLNGGSYSTIASGVSDTDYLDTVSASGTYCYVVQAVKGGSSSGNSNEACSGITVPVTPAPAAPTNLVAQQMTAKKQIGLSWTGSTGATSYRIYRKTATAPVAFIGSVSGTSAVNSGLKSGETYTYHVTAMGAAESGPSNESSATAR
jgi:cellulose 1,4-beta-cellobiosidase